MQECKALVDAISEASVTSDGVITEDLDSPKRDNYVDGGAGRERIISNTRIRVRRLRDRLSHMHIRDEVLRGHIKSILKHLEETERDDKWEVMSHLDAVDFGSLMSDCAVAR